MVVIRTVFKIKWFQTVKQPLEAIESLINYYGSRKLTANDYSEWPEKLEKTVEKIVLFDDKDQNGNDSASVNKPSLKRDYWVEFWDENSRSWICNIFFYYIFFANC